MLFKLLKLTLGHMDSIFCYARVDRLNMKRVAFNFETKLCLNLFNNDTMYLISNNFRHYYLMLFTD